VAGCYVVEVIQVSELEGRFDGVVARARRIPVTVCCCSQRIEDLGTVGQYY
jgi:hypothetical protein